LGPVEADQIIQTVPEDVKMSHESSITKDHERLVVEAIDDLRKLQLDSRESIPATPEKPEFIYKPLDDAEMEKQHEHFDAEFYDHMIKDELHFRIQADFFKW
jgi:hypothetical protein